MPAPPSSSNMSMSRDDTLTWDEAQSRLLHELPESLMKIAWETLESRRRSQSFKVRVNIINFDQYVWSNAVPLYL